MNPPIDLSLYLVTHRGSLSLEEFFRIILQSVEGGVKIVQLREKEASAREMISIGKRLHALLKPFEIPLIVNDRVDVAHAIQADGVHLGQSDLSVAEARAILGEEAIIGLSVETIEQVKAAADQKVDYIAASPVFSSKTKTDCYKPWGLEGLKQICAISTHPIVAIGGIDVTNVNDILDCGVSGIAIVSSIFNSSCPKTAAISLSKRIRQHAF
jgi:thiamine-phosphate pyrophosphorylase